MPSIPMGAFPPVDAGVPQTLGYDFGDFLPSGVTLIGTPQFTISVAGGSDPNPTSRITAGPQIGTISTAQKGTGVTNTSILIQITPLGAVNYMLQVTCGRSDGSDEVSGWGLVPGQLIPV